MSLRSDNEPAILRLLRHALTEARLQVERLEQQKRPPRTVTLSHGAVTQAAPAQAPAGDRTPDGQQIGRNDPCYCGSGKKFKKCHGR